MNGKLAGIFKGITQIGGLLNWELNTNLIPTGGNAQTYKFANWQLKAENYWFFDIPNIELTIKLYPDIGKGYWEGKGRIASDYQRLLNTLIHGDIELRGNGVFEGKE